MLGVGIQVRLKWRAIDYLLIFRHVQTTEIGPNLLTNLRQPRKIYARNCNYDRAESQPCLSMPLEEVLLLSHVCNSKIDKPYLGALHLKDTRTVASFDNKQNCRERRSMSKFSRPQEKQAE